MIHCETGGLGGTVVLLTAAYPYGHTSETFLDAEIPVLARRFERVIVLPSHVTDDVRQLPPNVRCEPYLAEVTALQAMTELGRFAKRAVFTYVRAVADEGAPHAYLAHPRPYVASLGRNLRKYRLLKQFIRREKLNDAVFYDYWLENSTLALSWLRQEGVVQRAVARAHGFDVYEDRWAGRAVPFQAVKLGALDRVFPVSSHGLAHLAAKYPMARAKLTLSRLGVEQSGFEGYSISSHDPPVIVSCGGLQSFKRVDMIPRVVASIGRPVRWIHFGDGPDRQKVERAAAALPDHVEWLLPGHVQHRDLLEYYRRTKVALFISMSLSEGLPVSMMEAISFGIPVLAVSVGGVPEIVTDHTGTLVSADDPVESVASEAGRLLNTGRPSVEQIIRFSKANFDAQTNFHRFAGMLQTL